MNAPTRPPVPDSPLSRPYWEAAHQGRLVIQQCGQCGKRRHYPRLLCDACHTSDCTWVEASGRGLIHSWTVTHHAFHPAVKAELCFHPDSDEPRHPTGGAS